MVAKREDGGAEFQRDVLSTIFRAINRYLDVKGYGTSISNDYTFQNAARCSCSKTKDVTKKGYGGNQIATRELTDREVNLLYFTTIISETADGLYRGMWWLLAIHAGWRAVEEANMLEGY